jgi:hypothetical protein
LPEHSIISIEMSAVSAVENIKLLEGRGGNEKYERVLEKEWACCYQSIKKKLRPVKQRW